MQPKFKGRPINLTGNALNIGDNAPKIAVTKGDLSQLYIGGAAEKTQILISALSIDTPACSLEARIFNAKCAMLEGVQVYFITADLPFALNRFASSDEIELLTMLSDYRERAFGRAYGILIGSDPIANLLARSVFVVSPEGKIAYKEIVEELTNEPNYDAAIVSARDLAEKSRAKLQEKSLF